MKQFFYIITILLMNISINMSAQNFFSGEKSLYKVYFMDRLLPTEGAEKVIEILENHQWKIDENQKEGSIQMVVPISQSYRYKHSYNLQIENPQKQKVILRFNSGGLKKDLYLITASSGDPYGTLKMEDELHWREIEKLKELFATYVDNINNLEIKEGQRVELISSYIFYGLFYLSIPPIIMTDEDSKELIRLYNTAWNNRATYFPMRPSPSMMVEPVFPLYEHFISFQYGNEGLDYTKPTYEFSLENKEKLQKLIDKVMKGHNGDEKITYKPNPNKDNVNTICYMYRNGVLDGNISISDSSGILLNVLEYEAGVLQNTLGTMLMVTKR